MERKVLLLCIPMLACCLLSVSGSERIKHKHVESVFDLPVPDMQLPAPLPDHPLPHLAELRAIMRHTAAQGQGIDVSHYQGHIQWDFVARDRNVQFVYIKATEGAGLVDNMYLRNFYGAKRVGIPVGVYHFFSPTASPLVQLENFRENVDPRQQDLIPIIDVEKCGRGPLVQFQGRLKAFLIGVEKMFGVKPIIYTGVNFYAKCLAGKFTGYRFMVARYSDEFPGLCEDVPILLWQYTCEGKVEGIKGHVDRSVFLDRYTLSDIMLRK